MGNGFNWKCDDCGYTFKAFLGVGFMFPMVYRETVQDMKRGKFGKQDKRFFEEHPNGAITCHNILLRCKKCGEYESGPELKLYVPKTDDFKLTDKGKWSVAFPFEGAEYVSNQDIKEYYEYYGQHEHKCSKCKGVAEIIEEAEELECPHCKGIMKKAGMILWD